MGAGVGVKGAGVGVMGAGVGVTGACVGVMGAGVEVIGAGVGVTGAGVGVTGAGVGVMGAGVGRPLATAAIVGRNIDASCCVVLYCRESWKEEEKNRFLKTLLTTTGSGLTYQKTQKLLFKNSLPLLFFLICMKKGNELGACLLLIIKSACRRQLRRYVPGRQVWRQTRARGTL
jgi:hypothetical protein